MTDMQYNQYLSRVGILNQKKEFLRAFRGQLPIKQKLKLVQKIKQQSKEIQELEAEIFKSWFYHSTFFWLFIYFLHFLHFF